MTTQLQTGWRSIARCRLNPDLWTTRKAAKVHLALHICRRHCPVRHQCATEAQTLPTYHRYEVVLGGVAYAGNGMPSVRQGAAERCGSCRPVTLNPTRRVEDEGLTEREMDLERDLDEAEAEADRESVERWRQVRDE